MEEIQVTKEQYNLAIRNYSGYIFHRQESGEYWIKIWLHGDQIKKTLNL